ncbi:MAG: phosphoglucosamine mutase [Nitrososphaerales archaeon]|nr:phosphoglucosamine mutase [Nitrososphaerales archaeon]
MIEERRFFGTNGIRFKPGIDFGLDFVIEMAEAIGTYFAKGPILVGYDGRITSPMIAKAVMAGLMSVGLQVGDAGLLPTPALQYATSKLGYNGSVMITASHNPPEYNGIKVMGSDGVEISREDELKIERIFLEKSIKRADWRSVGIPQQETKALSTYIQGILSHVDADLIGSKKFKVVLDLGNGVQSLAAPYILERLGCEVITINSNIDGEFSGRGAEPTVETLTGLSKLVKAHNADLGVGYDGDGDRSIFCDEDGVIHTGDRSGAVIMDYVLSRRPKSLVVTTVSTSQIIEYIANRYESKVVRTRVGSVDVSRKMIELKALFGIEENGGCFYAPHIPVRDGAMSTALMLECMARRNQKLSQLIGELPRFYQRKAKFACPNEFKNQVMKSIERYAEGEVERIDGIKLWIDRSSWILLRPSGTEPLIRVFAESDDEKKLEDLISRFSSIIEDSIKKVRGG